MEQADILKGSKSLTCPCGFYTSHASYMLLHIKQQGDGCVLTDGHIALLQNELRRLDITRQIADRTLTTTIIEIEFLHKLVMYKRTPDKPRARLCRLCHKPTMEWSPDGSPECNKHVTRDDGLRNTLGQTKSDILATLLSSKK